MKNAKKLFWTTLLLTASSFVMKTVAVWFNVYLSGQIGAAGIGLWNLILSVYFMLKTAGAAGMNLLSTRLVIDEPESINSNLKKLYVTALITGTLGMLVLLLGAPMISERFLGGREGVGALAVLSASLPFLAASTCTGGYSTAQRKMARYAVLQVAEQALRIAVSIFTLSRVDSANVKSATLALALGITLGEIFSFITGLVCVLWDRRNTRDARPSRNYGHKLKTIALPDGAGSIFRSLLSTVQNLLIPQGMRKSGASLEGSLEAYGRVHGMALPVVLYPSSVLGVLSGLLVPEIASSKAKERWEHIRYILFRVLHLALIFSMVVAGVMFGFAKELSLTVYGSREAEEFIRLLAPLIPVMYMDMTSDGLLKGLGMQKQIMAINVSDSVISVIMIYFLVPKMGIYGYIFMIYFTELFNFVFSFCTLMKKSRFSLNRMKRSLLLPVLAITGFLVTKALFLPLSFARIKTECIAKITTAVVVYFLLVTASGVLSGEDLRWVKKILK